MKATINATLIAPEMAYSRVERVVRQMSANTRQIRIGIAAFVPARTKPATKPDNPEKTIPTMMTIPTPMPPYGPG